MKTLFILCTLSIAALGQQLTHVCHAQGRLRLAIPLNTVYCRVNHKIRWAVNYDESKNLVIVRNPLHSHRQGPIYLNVLKYLDVPQAVAMAAERTDVLLIADDPAAWDFAKNVNEKLGWGLERDNGLHVVKMPDSTPNGK